MFPAPKHVSWLFVFFPLLLHAQSETEGHLLSIQRTYRQLSDSSFDVVLNFDASILSGELKITESVDGPCSCKAEATDNVLIETKDNQISFGWSALNGLRVVNLEYGIQCREKMDSASLQINTAMYYKGKDLPYAVTNTPFGNGVGGRIEADGQDSVKLNPSAPANLIRKRTGDLVYSVQLLSGPGVLSYSDIHKQYGYDGTVALEIRSDRIVYLSGTYSSYKEARANCDVLRATCPTLPGPFVVAYMNGQRIAVADALAIEAP